MDNYKWETLWDGVAKYSSSPYYNGYFYFLWETIDNYENRLSVGDTVRITVDGVVSTLAVYDNPKYDKWVEAGNKWLGNLSGSTTAPSDDGTDIYFYEYRGQLAFYTRDYYPSETLHVKFERATAVPVGDTPKRNKRMSFMVGMLLNIVGNRNSSPTTDEETDAYAFDVSEKMLTIKQDDGSLDFSFDWNKMQMDVEAKE